MNAKHQFKYTYNETDLEEYSPLEVTFEIPATATITQMLNNFEQYLKACGYVFSGKLDIVEDTYPEYLDELDGSLYEFNKEDVHIDLDQLYKKECGCLGDSITPKDYQEQRLKEWNEGIAKLDKEVKEQKEIREKSSLRADELKEMNECWNKLSNDEKANCLNEALKKSGIKLEPEDNCWNS